jgi:hypothetical protein
VSLLDFAETANADPTGILLQYGALGVLTLLAVLAVRVMYVRLVAAYEREKERADRLESELRQLNQMIRSEYVGTIGNATRAIADANEAVTNALSAVRRDGRR